MWEQHKNLAGVPRSHPAQDGSTGAPPTLAGVAGVEGWKEGGRGATSPTQHSPSFLQGLQLPHHTPSPTFIPLSMPPDAKGWEQTIPLGWGLKKGKGEGRMTNLLSGKIAPLNI